MNRREQFPDDNEIKSIVIESYYNEMSLGYYVGAEDNNMEIYFCPFCGKKLAPGMGEDRW
jgi:hypothetical protein